MVFVKNKFFVLLLVGLTSSVCFGQTVPSDCTDAIDKLQILKDSMLQKLNPQWPSLNRSARLMMLVSDVHKFDQVFRERLKIFAAVKVQEEQDPIYHVVDLPTGHWQTRTAVLQESFIKQSSNDTFTNDLDSSYRYAFVSDSATFYPGMPFYRTFRGQPQIFLHDQITSDLSAKSLFSYLLKIWADQHDLENLGIVLRPEDNYSDFASYFVQDIGNWLHVFSEKDLNQYLSSRREIARECLVQLSPPVETPLSAKVFSPATVE